MLHSSSPTSKSAQVPAGTDQHKLNKRLFQVLLGLIFLAFSALFMMILIKLPGAF